MGMNPKAQQRQATVGERLDALGQDVSGFAEATTTRLEKIEQELRRLDAQDLGLTKRLDTVPGYIDLRDAETRRSVDSVRLALYGFRDRGFWGRLSWLVRGV